jgi:hypothetical protein
MMSMKENVDKLDHSPYISYIQETTDIIARLLITNGIHTIYEQLNKVTSCHGPFEDRQPPNKKPTMCKIILNCGRVLISQTGCHISSRVSEFI